MDTPHDSSPTAEHPRHVGRFLASQALIWLLVAPILAAALARVAVWVQNYRAPLIIFPLLVGCGLGVLLWGLMRLAQVGHRATIWSGAVMAVLVAVAGQHYFSFLDYRAARMAAKPQGLSLAAFEAIKEKMPDQSTGFLQFMQRQADLGRDVNVESKLGGGEYKLRGAAAWASWAFDGLLTLIATLTIIYLACRAPYCSACRSWFRTIRTGPLAAERVGRMVEAAGLPIEKSPGEFMGSAQYRLSHCASGCGPSRLELAWRSATGNKLLEGWLSAAQREQVMRVLDGDN